MPEVSVNYLAVLVAAIVNMIIGALWYSPLLFGKSWMGLVGKSEEDLRKENSPIPYIIAFVSSLIMAYVLSHIIDYIYADSILEGLQAGFWSWLGFTATTFATNYAFQRQSTKLYLIDALYYLVGLLVMGIILAVWA
ncbi:MAG: DUF1761 family protein [candidate division Zixibacteria bacterium]|nr:DUF1761 family protein [candidate division Zixibacteria bacterium]